MSKFLRLQLISKVAPARSLAAAEGLEQAEQFPKTTYHKTLKIWASLEEIGSQLATGEIFADTGWSNCEGVKRRADKL
jgi:hypothetical protein